MLPRIAIRIHIFKYIVTNLIFFFVLEQKFEVTSPASIKIDGLPKPMIDKYLNRFRNATENQKKIIETCLSALSCVVSDTNSSNSSPSSCFKVEKECITSRLEISNSTKPDQNIHTNQDGNAKEVSSKRLEITYLNGDKWSKNQRRTLLECKTENLLCQLPQPEEDYSEIDVLDPFAIEIRFAEENGNICVNG